MEQFQTLAIAVLTGFISGVLLCIPVGPVNLTIMNEGARRGFKWAALIGIGATLMEMIYCGVAFTGFAALFEGRWIKAAIKVFSFLFMMFLGGKFTFAKRVTVPLRFPHAVEKMEERVEEKLHPHSAFMIGFVRTLANPGVLLGWVVLIGIFGAHGLVQPNWGSRFACLAGVGAGVGLWFIGLSWAISRGHNKFTDAAMLKMERGSGILLLIFGLGQGLFLVWELAKHRV